MGNKEVILKIDGVPVAKMKPVAAKIKSDQIIEGLDTLR
jgi:hypothetical protein